MKKFIIPEIELRELTPSQSIMDDITISSEKPGFTGIERLLNADPANDEAVW